MRSIATEINLTIFKTYTLNIKSFAWRKKYSTPFNLPIFLFTTLHLFEVSRNISGITPYF